MNPIANDILMHYGVGKMDGAPGRGSGRYPLGSGENPNQHSGDLLSRIDNMKKAGMSETEIAAALDMTTTQLRVEKAIAKDERRSQAVATARRLREEGYSLNEIAAKMGYNNDSSVRSLLNKDSESKMNQSKQTAEYLKQQIAEKGMIDVGVGVEKELNVSREKLNQAIYILQQEGYPVYNRRVPQVTNPGKFTTLTVACPKGTEHKAIYNYGDIHSVGDYISHDGGDSFDPKWVYPKSMDSSRLQICYAEDGGIKKDGLIEIRRGVDDLSLGESHYAQVRILVDGTHYIKGMAVYSDDLPDGVDVIFNTNKTKGTPTTQVLKKIKDDPSNPFGSLIKEGIVDPDKGDGQKGGQSYYYDKDGNKQLSLINKRAEEGDWGEWSNTLSSQFLSKQSESLIKKQLNLAASDKQTEFDDICQLTNPTLKKVLLKSFSDDCDAAAVHLKAAALPRQRYQVIIPLTNIKDNEVYAPNFDSGETVALIRYPHGGTFEIPILKVNNKLPEGKKVLTNAPADAIGISANVASRLSGADFDGDTVMVIPCNSYKSKVKITSTPALEDLKGFDPKVLYGADSVDPVKKDSKGHEYYIRGDRVFQKMSNTQTEMGKISNLITDMTLKGATEKELARAVKHSMVVIDAEKHILDYKQSEVDNDIPALKKKYQAHADNDGYGGASTLISKASSKQVVDKRRGSPIIDPETGEQSWKTVHEEYIDKDGKVKKRTQDSTKMAETKDAHTLSSGTPQEELYADYANRMKSLANQARKEMISTGKIEYSASAKKTYLNEYNTLNAKLNIALKNAPRERQAQVIANSVVAAKVQDNPDMSKAEKKKAKAQALSAARTSVGARREKIEITDKEWEAIQAGAISENKLYSILNNADLDDLRERSMPRKKKALSQAKISKIQAMKASGYSTSDIAEAIGVSSSTVSKYLSGNLT